MKRIIITGAALAALAVASTSASAMPVRNLQVDTWEYSTTISANAYSPPYGACGAYYGVRILGEYGEVLRSRFGRFNACQAYARDGSGWSMGTIRASFNVTNLPAGTYAVCVGAGNRNVGVGGLHAICRYRRI